MEDMMQQVSVKEMHELRWSDTLRLTNRASAFAHSEFEPGVAVSANTAKCRALG